MSANTKWEAVEAADLHDGDKVRVTSKAGEVVIGAALFEHAAGSLVRVQGAFGEVWPHQWAARELTFERAVPERTLPTEPGLYQGQFNINQGGTENAPTYRLRWDTTWANMAYPDMEMAADHLPADLVRLVPVTEADELRKRIEKAREYVSGIIGGSSVESTILALLDGEG